jgi:hypothetical protein
VSQWKPPMEARKRTCSVPGCERPYLAKGCCRAHYERERRTGFVDANVPFGPGRNSAEQLATPVRLIRVLHDPTMPYEALAAAFGARWAGGTSS